MPAAFLDKLFYGVSLLLVSISSIVLVWSVSPLTTLNPHKVLAAGNMVVAPPKIIKPHIISGTPIRIAVPSLAIDLPVEAGNYDVTTNAWTIANKKAFYATLTSLPNNYEGNTLIYGHNNWSVFKPLHSIAPDAELLVYSDNGYIFHYTYRQSERVIPTDTTIFNYEGPPALTLQTCDGTWNEVRQMFSFDFASVEKI